MIDNQENDSPYKYLLQVSDWTKLENILIKPLVSCINEKNKYIQNDLNDEGSYLSAVNYREYRKFVAFSKCAVSHRLEINIRRALSVERRFKPLTLSDAGCIMQTGVNRNSLNG